MTRLTYLPVCLLLAPRLVIGVQGASTPVRTPAGQPLVKSQTSTARGARLPPRKAEDGSATNWN